jgi:hypothetical protein
MPIQTFDFQFFSRWPNGLPALARAEKQVRSNPASTDGCALLSDATCFERRRSAASRAHHSGSYLGDNHMKLVRLTSLSALVAAVFIASFNVAQAEARTICKGSGVNAKCYTVKAKKKKFAKRAKVRAAAARQRRVAKLRDPWHGWAHPSIWMACAIREETVRGPRSPTTTTKVASTRRRSGFCPIAAGSSLMLVCRGARAASRHAHAMPIANCRRRRRGVDLASHSREFFTEAGER